AFGLRIINEHYDRLKWNNKPEVWTSDPERTIKQEIQQLKRNLANVIVTIYKIESELTGKCYIGQTTNPYRRRREHFPFEDSSNSGLRQAMLNEGQEHFNFYSIDEVKGKFANRSEAEYIEYYKNRAVINLVEPEVEQLEADKVKTHISIYKIENKTTGVCYIVQSIDSERNKVEDFTNSSNEELRNVIENESIDQFTFDILHKDVPNGESLTLVKHAVKNASSRSHAVFNQQNPLKQRYSDQIMIELFCEHFNIRYEEFLKHPSDVENLAEKIEDFEKIVEKVQKAKRETNINFTSTSSINGIIHSIIESIDDPVVGAFAEKYEKKKRKANAIDFQDMILYAVYLLEVYPDILDGYREKYDYVLIDEFQDVSPIDFRLTKPLSENYFVVGDDDQAIYGFRGGDSEIMLNFHKQENVKEYKITRNHRSTSAIVEHSKILIEHNTLRINKNLHAKNPVRPPIKVLETKQE
ncbi:UvrD-helicase domain-containing protein, partial [Candidatus Poribacteria bacterium]|nr:UvrD-helicase domain-containing protein [Candidatus Poribacteria bacterium]